MIDRNRRYLDAYNEACRMFDPDTVNCEWDDPRRDDIIKEMKVVAKGNRAEIKKAIEWWTWSSPQEMWAWVRRFKKALSVKK